MAVKIRLKKMGRRHRPFFRLCAMDSRSPRDGRVIEELGIYDPMVPETDARAILKGERIDYWLSVGAQPTPKVGVLIKKYGTDGTHLDQQQQALGRLASRRADAIVSATSAAQAAAENAPPPAAAEPAAKASTETAEAAATEESTEATEEATPAQEPVAEESAGEKAESDAG
ncbi:MAG: 30S ribosomal protein S16 [Pirellulaceae bacterium]